MINLILNQMSEILFSCPLAEVPAGWQGDLLITLTIIIAVGFLWLLYRFVRGLFSFLRWW